MQCGIKIFARQQIKIDKLKILISLVTKKINLINKNIFLVMKIN